jgi:pimeloyl-ACP methyl ester carboxylesterase
MQRHHIIALAALILGSCFSDLAPLEAAAGQYAKVSDDLDLYYEEAGTGTPMVLVPGWTASGVVFSHQIEHFSKSYHVIVYDPRSQGLSTQTLEHNDYTQHGRDLGALIDKLGLKHVIFVAWSAGCFDGYSYVRMQGTDNLAAFVCIDMPPRGISAQSGDWASFSTSDKDLARLRAQLDALANDRRGLSQGMAKAMNARNLSADETTWFVRQAMLAPTYAMLQLRLDSLFSDYRPEAKLLASKVPVLDAISEPNVPAGLTWIKANTPQAETFIIKRHMSFWSEPESFNSALDAFLEKVH